MEESGGDEGYQGDKISLLAEELVQLSVKSSMVEPSEKPTLLCTIWAKKTYNPDSFRAQMKSIWKTRKKFEIKLLGHGLTECQEVTPAERGKIRFDPPFSLALKVELNIVEKESLKLNSGSKKIHTQYSYIGDSKKSNEHKLQGEDRSDLSKRVQAGP
ncbi:hypothetical protein J1N35_022630 [Gossypium stocksii]|uniref:Uncharacterized protein n=1 Tax=Gossypium stocksii TaxID=47602 RepID=A0A9D4A3N3_9ROSI|nr:hypothetical protein J1N35_022630 [Gossypium stocksii]